MIKQYQDRIVQLERELNYYKSIATTDELTKLGNRREFNTVLSHYIAVTKRKDGCEFYLLIIDVDYFKKINDTLGHQYGDMVLSSIAQTLKKTLRQEDWVFRIGGDEFAAILSNGFDDLSIFDRLVENVRDLGFSVSVGIQKYDKSIDRKELIKLADDNLYKAKNNGRDQYYLEKQTVKNR